MARAAEEAGQPLPPMLANRPELPSEMLPFWEAFHTLSRARGFAIGLGGMALLPIAFSEISVAADRFGYSAPDDFDGFLRFVTALDDAYLVHSRKT